MTKKHRYAICGLSLRGIYQYALPLLGRNRAGGPNFDDRAELVAILDLDRGRVAEFCRQTSRTIPCYAPGAFRKMVRETRPDTLIVTGPDQTHCRHIVAGLDAGCDIITEKPMVIDCRQVRQVQAAEERNGRRLRVAHNYRYTPLHRRLKRLIQSGRLGRVVSVEFTYNLDTWHGSSYFYRWNSERAMSGGLSISKGCHHFDLVNWWLGDVPEEVFAFGGLNYFGKDGALRPRDARGRPFPPAEEKRRCPVFRKHYAGKFDPASNVIGTGWDELFGLPYDRQYPPGERRYLYDDGIAIEDSYSVAVRYRSGTTMSYSCNFCTPWEGYILGLNGTKGRLEVVHRSDPDPTGKTNPASDGGLITFYPLFGGKQLIEIPAVAGGHGGADFAIQRDLFVRESAESRQLQLLADSEAGAYAVATGEAVWRSATSRRPVNIARLLGR
jgi:predicted dehydrogenase